MHRVHGFELVAMSLQIEWCFYGNWHKECAWIWLGSW